MTPVSNSSIITIIIILGELSPFYLRRGLCFHMTKKQCAVLQIALSLIFIFSILLGVIHINAPSASASEVNFKKKIVSVLFDNSGSMLNDNRMELAKYSIEMLATLLNEENDELHITTMNSKDKVNDGVTFEIKLNNSDRQSEIQSLVDNKSIFSDRGTPHQPIGKALQVLEKAGLKSANDSSYIENDDTEYWLVILTDGAFDECKDQHGNGIPDQVAALIEGYIRGYPGLNTIYLSFGSKKDVVDLTDPNRPLNKNYLFNPYCIDEPELLISAMQDIANKISGRYNAEMSSGQYAVSGNTVIVDLDKFKFAVNNIAVIAQNCGAKLKSVTHNGKNLDVTQENELIGRFPTYSGKDVSLFDNGYVAVVQDGEYMSGGQVTFTYDGDVSPDNVSVLIEPAIYIEVYFEREGLNGSWVATTIDEINGEMRPKENIRVKYKVFNSVTNEEISLKEIFGEPTEKVTYDNKGYSIGQAIPLVGGSKTLTVTVSVLSGSYTLYANIVCYVEENPNYYRLDGQLDVDPNSNGRKATVTYTLYYDNQKVDRTGLNDFTFDSKITYPDGSEHPLDLKPNSDGTLSGSFDGSNLGYGEYVFTVKVVNNDTRVPKTNTQKFAIVPYSLDAQCLTTDSFSTTTFLLGKSSGSSVTFAISMDGKPESFGNSIINYKVTINGVDVTDKCRIDGDNLVFDITVDNLPDLDSGVKTVNVDANVTGTVFTSASYKFELIDSVYTVVMLDTGARELDITNIRAMHAEAYFTICRDNFELTIDEINAAMDNGEITIKHPFGTHDLMIDEQITVEELDGKTVVALRYSDGMAKPWDNLFNSFIFAKERTISLDYNGVSASGVITINNLNFMGRLWRWLVLLAIILFVLHVILYIIGFFVAKPLPKGTMLQFVVSQDLNYDLMSPFVEAVNLKRSEIILWHLSRFIPFRELKDQRPRDYWATVELMVEKKSKRPRFKIVSPDKLIAMDFDAPDNKNGQIINEMLEAYESGHDDFYLENDIKESTFMRFLRKQSGEEYENGQFAGLGWYGVLVPGAQGRDRIDSVITFVKYHKPN